MLRDNALKFDRDQAYDIPQKPFENSRNFYYIDRGHMLGDNALKFYSDHA